MQQPPPEAYPPGTQVLVKDVLVTIESYLAQGKVFNAGGFAFVYAVKVLATGDYAVLKRIACADEKALRAVVYEAETHKKISGHPHIVDFIEYAWTPTPSGFELLLLMEYCPGGHLVDYLNTRLQNRPSENEVLQIFHDICEAVAHLHKLQPPIAHRDIKIENVLLKNGQFKLCDFGSCTTQSYLANTMIPQDMVKMEDEIARFTTIQYRAPEMCDLHLKRELSEKVDMWAMGVLLYKLCFYVQ